MTTTTHSKLLTDDEIHDERICFAFMDWEHTAFKCGARWAERALLARLGEQQPVAWGMFDSKGFFGARHEKASAEQSVARYNESPENGGLKPYTAKPLYAHPPAARPVAQGDQALAVWRTIAEWSMVQLRDGDKYLLVSEADAARLGGALEASRSSAQGAAQVPLATLAEWKDQVNTLAVLSLKAERGACAIRLKQAIADVMAAAPHGEGDAS